MVILGALLPGSIGDRIAKAYDEHLFHGKTLQDMPDEPRFVINATNVQSGALWRFMKPYMRDYRVGKVENPKVPLAQAVAASSAFPPVLSPFELRLKDADFEPGTAEDLQRPPFTTRVVLTDGGVYDNLGLETAWKRHQTVLVSDAGGKTEAEEKPETDWPRHAYRVLNLIDNQVRSLRKRQVIDSFRSGTRKGAYWGIRTDISGLRTRRRAQLSARSHHAASRTSNAPEAARCEHAGAADQLGLRGLRRGVAQAREPKPAAEAGISVSRIRSSEAEAERGKEKQATSDSEAAEILRKRCWEFPAIGRIGFRGNACNRVSGRYESGHSGRLKVPANAQSADGRPKQFSIPADLVEHILLGPAGDRRVLQDSPLLGDVWAAFAFDPGNVQDVLITPHRTATAASVASIIPEGLRLRAGDREKETNPKPAPRDKESPKVAYLQGLVGARLYFDEVLCILVPLTQWWRQPKVTNRIAEVAEHKERLERLLRRDVRKQGVPEPASENFSSLERYIALAGLIYWVNKLERPEGSQRPKKAPGSHKLPPLPPLPTSNFEDAFAKYQKFVPEIIEGVLDAYPAVSKNATLLMELARADKVDVIEADVEGYIFQISLNRTATTALDRSIPAVKADAANSLFNVKCKNIVWAVLDSGIDDKHAAFVDQGRSRVRKTFDFTTIREIVSSEES